MKKIIPALLLGSTLVTPAMAAEVDITIENITRGVYFTPLLVAAHPIGTQLFQLGEAASTELQAMAEGGDISGLETQLVSLGATIQANPAEGLLGPGSTTMTQLNTDAAPANTQLSMVAMMLPTNDGFVAINSLTIPTEAGEYSYYVKAYDAGTEANDEVRGSGAPGESGFPVPPPLEAKIGQNGTAFAASAEGFVHVHRGVLGDTDANAGNSDIDSTQHRWLNPVAKVTITVQ
ncbi:MAG: spondin domain-containing protein [Gammaproteobacteria bacterium]|nr:spondin domain-containing protein [Gammaproteobacteria bacterium]